MSGEQVERLMGAIWALSAKALDSRSNSMATPRGFCRCNVTMQAWVSGSQGIPELGSKAKGCQFSSAQS